MKNPPVSGATTPAVFSFGPDSNVRVLSIDGEPWFVAADVCAALKIANSRDALEKLDDDERGVGLTDTTEGVRKVGIISESGLYMLIMRCRDAVNPGTLPHRFRKWVTGEVLPQIRQTGRYGQPAEDLEVTVFRGQGPSRTCNRYMVGGRRPALPAQEHVRDLLETSAKLLDIARDLMVPPLATAEPQALAVAAPVRPADPTEAEYQRTLGLIRAILAEPVSGDGWTAGRLERTHGGAHGRLRIGQKALRCIIEDALQRGDLVHRPGSARGLGYLADPLASTT